MVGKNLTLNKGALRFMGRVLYEFTIETYFYDKLYNQVVTIEIDPALTVPIVNLK
jgi:hypothetical protein